MKRLKLKSNGKGYFPNLELLALVPPVRRFIGWTSKTVNVDGKDRVQLVQKKDAEDVKYHTDYVKAVRNGDLLPGDKETADLCGVTFKENR